MLKPIIEDDHFRTELLDGVFGSADTLFINDHHSPCQLGGQLGWFISTGQCIRALNCPVADHKHPAALTLVPAADDGNFSICKEKALRQHFNEGRFA